MPPIYWTDEKQGTRSKAPRKVLVRVENDQQICTVPQVPRLWYRTGPKPDSGTEVKVHEDAVAGQGTLALEKSPMEPRGLRHLCERCKEARPNGARQVQSLHAT